MSNRQVSLIGAPTDVGASQRGSSLAPDALRIAGLSRALRQRGVDVRDCGNLEGPVNPEQAAVDGYRHLAEVAAWNRALYAATQKQLQEGRVPILLGGDHSLAIGSIAAVADWCVQRGRNLRVLWIDAHSDFNTCAITPTGNLHGMPLACLSGLGPAALTGVGERSPALMTSQIRQIGVRSVDPEEKQLIHQHHVDVYDMRYIDENGMKRAMQAALADVDTDTHLHVSFDVDALDPLIAPGVGTPVPGGINYREAQLLMEMVADTGLLGSLDIVELNPLLDTGNKSAELVVDLIESLFGKSTLMRE